MRIAQHPAKTKVLSMGRRWGKTFMSNVIVGNALAHNGKVAWIAPTYKNTRPLWREIVRATADDVKAKRMVVNRSDRTIETKHGGFLGIYSGDNIDSIRGEAFNLVVIDEAARIAEDAWSDAIMPTLADYDGDAILISTPKGKNWFYREWMMGQGGDSDVVSWQVSSDANPNPNIKKAFRKVQKRVTEHTFRTEWLAEFLDGGEVFRRVMDAATAEPLESKRGSQYVIGADWGKLDDFTAFVVMDIATRRMVSIDRFNQIDYTVQAHRLQALAERFTPVAIIAERNSMGEVIVEQLQRAGLPVHPFTTTNASKTRIIDDLAMAFERREIEIINDNVLINELQAYEMERTPSGMMRYSAPDGMHDDTVMALALAWYGASLPTKRAKSREY